MIICIKCQSPKATNIGELCNRCRLMRDQPDNSHKIDWMRMMAIKNLRARGKTYEDIGKSLNLSKQRIGQILKGNYE